MQGQETPGYEDFLKDYDKVDDMLRNRARDSQSTRLFVSQCYSYVRTLTPYEFQCLTEAIPEIEDKIKTICDLHEKIRIAIRDAFQEVSQNRRPL